MAVNSRKSQKGRKLLSKPKLFPRGSKAILYFRRRVGIKDKWISLGTSDPDEAQENLAKLVDAHTSVAALSKVERSAHKLAEVFVEGVTGKRTKDILLSDAHGKWASLTPSFKDIGTVSHKLYESIFRRFTEWAAENGIKSCAQVTREHALEYARKLWDGGITGKTYNDHLSHLSRVFSAVDALIPPSQSRPV